MILELKLTDDSGQVVAYTKSDQPWQPLQWKAPTGQPIIVDKNKNDVYLLYAFTIQPTCNLSLNFRKGINVASQPMQFPSQYQPSTPQVNPTGYSPSRSLPTGNLLGTKPESGK